MRFFRGYLPHFDHPSMEGGRTPAQKAFCVKPLCCEAVINSGFSAPFSFLFCIIYLFAKLKFTKLPSNRVLIGRLHYKCPLPNATNSNTPFIHKHIAYHYEDEVRLLCLKIPENEGWVNDWEKEEVKVGFYVKQVCL